MNIKSKATSLIEVLLYITFLAMVIPAIGSYIGDILSVRNKQQTIIEVETEVASILELIEYDVKRASTVTAPAAGTSGASISLTILEDTTTITRDYLLVSGRIVQSTDGGAAIPLTSNRVVISNLLFQFISPLPEYALVTFSFDMQYSNPGNKSEFKYSRPVHTSIELRPNL